MRALILSQVLLATDFSPASEAAFRYASVLADRFNARLYVLHIVSEAEAAAPGSQTSPAGRENSGAMREIRNYLSAEPRDYIMAALPGDPSRRILAKARELKVDLIVLGAHHGAPSPLTRDVVQEVCESSPCPVICVPIAGSKELQDDSRC